MVKHHILIGLGLKKNNFRNRGLQRMLNRAGKAIMGSALPQNQMTIQPYSRPVPKIGGVTTRRPLKFNY